MPPRTRRGKPPKGLIHNNRKSQKAGLPAAEGSSGGLDPQVVRIFRALIQLEPATGIESMIHTFSSEHPGKLDFNCSFESVLPPDELTSDTMAVRKRFAPLTLAISSEELRSSGNLVSLLIEKGANVNHEDLGGRTPLLCAIRANLLEVADYLLSVGGQVNQVDSTGRTLLMYAVKDCSIEILEYLCNKGAAVDQADSSGVTPFMYAATVKDDGVASMGYLLSQTESPIIYHKDHFDNTVLDFAMASGSLVKVQYLFEQGAIVCAAHLVTAIRYNAYHIAEFLFTRMKNVGPSEMSQEAITYLLLFSALSAPTQGHEINGEFIEFLIKHANPDKEMHDSALQRVLGALIVLVNSKILGFIEKRWSGYFGTVSFDLIGKLLDVQQLSADQTCTPKEHNEYKIHFIRLCLNASNVDILNYLESRQPVYLTTSVLVTLSSELLKKEDLDLPYKRRLLTIFLQKGLNLAIPKLKSVIEALVGLRDKETLDIIGKNGLEPFRHVPSNLIESVFNNQCADDYNRFLLSFCASAGNPKVWEIAQNYPSIYSATISPEISADILGNHTLPSDYRRGCFDYCLNVAGIQIDCSTMLAAVNYFLSDWIQKNTRDPLWIINLIREKQPQYFAQMSAAVINDFLGSKVDFKAKRFFIIDCVTAGNGNVLRPIKSCFSKYFTEGEGATLQAIVQCNRFSDDNKHHFLVLCIGIGDVNLLTTILEYAPGFLQQLSLQDITGLISKNNKLISVDYKQLFIDFCFKLGNAFIGKAIDKHQAQYYARMSSDRVVFILQDRATLPDWGKALLKSCFNANNVAPLRVITDEHQREYFSTLSYPEIAHFLEKERSAIIAQESLLGSCLSDRDTANPFIFEQVYSLLQLGISVILANIVICDPECLQKIAANDPQKIATLLTKTNTLDINYRKDVAILCLTGELDITTQPIFEAVSSPFFLRDAEVLKLIKRQQKASQYFQEIPSKAIDTILRDQALDCNHQKDFLECCLSVGNGYILEAVKTYRPKSFTEVSTEFLETVLSNEKLEGPWQHDLIMCCLRLGNRNIFSLVQKICPSSFWKKDTFSEFIKTILQDKALVVTYRESFLMLCMETGKVDITAQPIAEGIHALLLVSHNIAMLDTIDDYQSEFWRQIPNEVVENLLLYGRENIDYVECLIVYLAQEYSDPKDSLDASSQEVRCCSTPYFRTYSM
jgi:ankyrin repeat protein